MGNTVQKVKDRIDWTIVTSTIVATVIIGGAVFAMRKAGLGKVATFVKGG